MRKTVKLFVLLFIFFIVLGNVSFAKIGEINSADYSLYIKEDGKLEVIEIIDLSLEKDIDIFSKRFDQNLEITNLDVKEYNKEGEVKIEYENVDNMNELRANSYFFDENTLKVKVDKNVRKYLSISYSLENNINIYNNCAEINLVLQENDFDYFSEEITGKVQFEDDSINLNDIYVWGHAENDVMIKRDEDFNQIKFILDEKEENQKFDVRVIFPKEIIKIDNLEITNNEITLEEIIKKENDVEQAKKFKMQSEIMNLQLINMIVFITILILIIIISFVIIRNKIKKDKNDESVVEDVIENVARENIGDSNKQEEVIKTENKE